MNIVCVAPHKDPMWEQLVRSTRSSVFHSPEWMRTLTETYGLQLGAYVVLDSSGQPRAGIPYAQVSDILGDRRVTLPFSDYCDPLVTDSEDWDALVEALLSEGVRWTIRCLGNQLPLKDPRFTTLKRARWHCLDVRPTSDEVWQTLDESAKRAINKAQRDGVSVHIGQTRDELREFYDMHLGVRKYKYRLLAQPFAMFEGIWRHFLTEQKGLLMLARLEGRAIGGVLFLQWGDTLYYKFNASAPAGLAYRPNDLLMWEGIKYAIRHGHRTLDFGLSDWEQEGLVRYKRKFATKEGTIYSFGAATPGEETGREHDTRTLLGEVTALLTDRAVPDSVTERAGEVLYKYFA